MKTQPHPHFDLFDEYPELRPGPDRNLLTATVKRKVRPPYAKARRGDVDFYVECECGDAKAKLDIKSANHRTAAEYMKLLIETLKPDAVVYKDSGREVEAVLKEEAQ